MPRPSSPDLRPRLWDLLVVLAVVLLTAGSAWWFYGGQTGGARTCVITHRGDEIARFPLPAEETVAVDGTYHLTITASADGVTVTASDCPGQDCVHTGTISRAGQSIVCLPEQVVIRLEGRAATDDPDITLG